MRCKPYPAYKPSGVAWLGDVPAHWEVKALKRDLSVINGGTPSSSEDTYWDGEVAWFTPEDLGNLETKEIETSRRRITKDGVANSGANIAPKKSVLISTRAPIGHVAVTRVEGSCNQGCRFLVPRNEVSSDFTYYALIAFRDILQNAGKGTTFLELSASGLGGHKIAFPRETEQRAIAAFLDRETGRIDTLVAKKRELIERLQEKRTALISHAVTCGLDPKAKLKPSGLPWLGDIPAHWDPLRLKFRLLKIEQGWSPQCDNTPAADGEWGVLKAGAVNGVAFDPLENKRLPENEVPLESLEIREGDFLMSRANTRELLGSAAIVGRTQPRLLLCDKLYRLSLRQTALRREFLLRFMRSTPGRCEFERDASGSSASMQNIGQDSVRNLWLAVPPAEEQDAIIRHLDKQTAKLDALVHKAEEAIERLQEYRTALITAAVTGKIDVNQ